MKVPKPTTDARRVPWLVTALLVLLLVLVPVLAWFQYQWTGEASRAEVFRMRSNLRTTMLHLSSDFQAAVTLAGVVGLPDPREPAPSDEITLAAASRILEGWRQSNEVPGLITGAWVLFDTQARYLLADGLHWSPPVALESLPANPLRSSIGLARGRRLLLELNPSVVTQILVPILVNRYFAGAEGLPGYLLTLHQAANSGAPGAVIWSSDKNLQAPELAPEASLSLLGNSGRFGPVLPNFAGGELGPEFSREMTLPAELGGRIVRIRANDPPPLFLEARHVDGSLEAAAERVRWLNLSGTFTLLSVLTFGFLFLYRLYNRNRLAVRAQQDFVSSVSHELKSPLAVLRAAAENLKEGVVSQPEQAQRYGERMLSEADRLLFLTENILRYAGLEAQPWSLDGQPSLDLLPVLTARLATWGDTFGVKGAHLAGKGPSEPLWVRGREADLAAIADNLLSNALKHGTTGTPPQVTLSWGKSAGRRGSEVWFAVEDNGRGLHPREQKKVFEPFYRPRGTTVSGVGLGLSLVARLSSAHGGRVELASAPGAGAKFTVVLPEAAQGDA